MEDLTSVEEIEKKIESLPPEEQLRLLEALARHLRKTGLAGTREELNWEDLYGLGKNLWKGEDAQEYVDRSRENRI